MFNQQEVQILIGGVNSPIDLEDLRRHTNYGGLYDDNHPVVEAFWKVRLFLICWVREIRVGSWPSRPLFLLGYEDRGFQGFA